MHLFANRFAIGGDGCAIDLATGSGITIVESSAGGDSEQRQWTLRCDALHRLRHPDRRQLVDFGPIGEHRRFEAWTTGREWMEEDLPIYAQDARGEVPDRAWTTRACALEIVPRSAVGAMVEMMDPASAVRPRAVALWGEPGAGMRTALVQIARAARLSGLVPVCADTLTPAVVRLVADHTLLVIAGVGTAGWRALLAAVSQRPRPHMLLLIAQEEARRVPSIALGRLPAARLIDAVRPGGLHARLATQIRAAAERSQGLPGRFARLLWGRAHVDGDSTAHVEIDPGFVRLSSVGSAKSHAFSPAPRTAVRAAEQPAIYGAGCAPSPSVPLSATWASASELAVLGRRRDEALALLAAGRHAEAERCLRQTAAALARREDWRQAAQTGLALVDAVARRGRLRDAQRALTDAREWAIRAADESCLIDVAIRAGGLWIDAAQLDDADAALAGAAAAARALGDGPRLASLALARARCSFWRGRYADAEQHLAGGGERVPGAPAVRLQIAASRAAIGLRDHARGVALALEALQRAVISAPDLECEAACAAAFAHLAVNDLDAVARDVRQSVAAARKAYAPLAAIQARLLGAEAVRRAGRTSVAEGVLRRLSGIGGRALPPILLARRDLVAELASAQPPSEDLVVHRLVQRTGLAALALFAPASSRTRLDAPDEDGMSEVVAILTACQDADDETRVLGDLCRRCRTRLDAASVAVVASDGAALTVVASNGGRIENDIAARAIAARAPIPAHRVHDSIEAAAPVVYGGGAIGAVVARWTLTGPPSSRAAPLILLIATAVAPIVASLGASRARAAAGGSSEIVGISRGTAELRDWIERSAPAPFPVLIEGESGSGKELVARAVHRRSSRRDRRFCTLNCAALPDDLVEAELFGHARGAFTGAAAERRGVFEEADSGTLFLDEIGELSPRAQAKILRVVQEGEVRRVGENTARRVDVRILAATNRNLRDEVSAGRFRLDLLYRLDVLRVVVRPLRERREDIPVLVDHFWRELTSRVGSRATLAPATVGLLARYDWPGNVRELQNVLASLAVRSPKRGVVSPLALPPPFVRDGESCRNEWRLDRARQLFETEFVRAALVRAGGRRTQAAAELGVTRQGLTKLMARLGIGSGSG